MNANESIHNYYRQYGNGNVEESYGLTKREYIATAIMAGTVGFAPEIAARIAVERADALIKELSK